jgi:hypothetical protein
MAWRAGVWSWREARSGAACALCVLLHGAATSAAPALLSVDRDEAAADCPDAAQLTRRVEEIRQSPLGSLDRGELERSGIDVVFTRSPRSYDAKVTFAGTLQGVRYLHDRGATCDALAQAVSVTIALALDRARQQSEDSPSRERTESAAPIASKQAPSRERGSTRPASWGFGMALQSGPAFAFGSAMSWSVAGHVRGSYQRLALELGMSSVLPDTTAAGSAELRTSWIFADAGACYNWGARYTAGPCARFAAGRLSGSGSGFEQGREARLFWAAAAAGLVVRGPIAGAIGWELGGTLWLPLRELTLSVENEGTVWRASHVSAQLGAGLSAEFR